MILENYENSNKLINRNTKDWEMKKETERHGKQKLKEVCR